MDAFTRFRAYLSTLGTVEDEDMEAIVRLTRVRSLRKRWLMVHAGDSFKSILWVSSGYLRLCYEDSSGNDHVVELTVAEQILADWHNLRTGQPTQYHIDAPQGAEVIEIPRANRDELVAAVPLVERMLRVGALTSLARYQARVALCLKPSAEDRLRGANDFFPDLVGLLPGHQLAKYLGLDAATLSRVRTKLNRGETGKET